jgi:hypothetical protein
MTELSSQAQAVLDALYMDELNGPQQMMARAHAAAALYAAANQVAPLPPPSNSGDPERLKGIWDERRTIRTELLAIAAELENTHG